MLHLQCNILLLSLFSLAGFHPEGAAAARDEEATALPPVLLIAGRELSTSSTPLTQQWWMSESKYLLSGPNKCSIFFRRKHFILCHYIFFMRNIEESFYDGSRSGDSEYSAELEKQTHQQSCHLLSGLETVCNSCSTGSYIRNPSTHPVQTELGYHTGSKDSQLLS